MKKMIFVLLACLFLTGCAEKSPKPVQLSNPWVDYDTLAEAEAAVGFPLGLPETVEGSYEAQRFRVMDGGLLEVVYRDGAFEVTVRKMAGEDQDISGVYQDLKEKYRKSNEDLTIIHKYGESGEVLTLMSFGGYSYSYYAPNGYWGASMEGFLIYILNELPVTQTWAEYDTLAGAEAEVGFSLDMPETIGDFRAQFFRVMGGQMLEVVYQKNEYLVYVHKMPGEGQDLSLDPEDYDSCHTADGGGWMVTYKERGQERLDLVSCGGYSYSLYTFNGWPEGAEEAFLESIYG